jgi:glycosyltransferase involved in cell wall biosynthesis
MANREDQMKRIAILVGNIYKTGGTERATVNLAGMLCNQGYDVTILSIYPSAGQTLPYEILREIQIVELNHSNTPTSIVCKPFWYLRLAQLLRNKISEGRFDMMVGTGHGINTLLPFIRVGKKIKAIGCEHIAYHTLPFISALVRRIVYPYLDGLVVLTRTAEEKFHYVKNVARIPNSLPFYPDKPSDLSSKQLLAVGRLAKVKGFDRLISAMTEVFMIHPDWKLKIVGEGELEDALKTRVNQLGIKENIVFCPFTTNILPYYLESSIYVLTSYSEAFPMVLLEAMACGIPVVSFNCPEGPADMIRDGADGFLVNDGDLSMFAGRIKMLIEQPELRTKFGIAARQEAEKYDISRIERQWKDFLKDYV